MLFAKTGIPEILRTAVQKPQVVGARRSRTRPTLHLQGEVSGEKLNPLIGSTLKPEVMYPVDLWIDETVGNAVQHPRHRSRTATAG